MLGRIGGAAIALGLIVTVPDTLAQEAAQPALESQPIPRERQEESGSASQQDASPEQASAPDLLSAIQGIETAIRDMIAEEDNIARQRQEDREISDLQAQKNMAFWAMLMFFVTLATVVLTAVGVFLIWKTLQYTKAAATYTKTAADAAVDSVDGARKGTVAARHAADAAHRANELNREAMVVEQRAWLAWNYNDFNAVSTLRWDSRKGSVGIRGKLRNTGHSPAMDVSWFSAIVPSSEKLCDEVIELLSMRCRNPPMRGTAVFPNDIFTIDWTATINEAQLDAESSIRPTFVAAVGYRLAFSQERLRTIIVVDISRRPSKTGITAIGPEFGDIPAGYLQVSPTFLRRHVIAD